MNEVRKNILKDVGTSNYTDFGLYKDLISFCVCEGYFSYDTENDVELEADFEEVVVVVEKEWLFSLIKSTEQFETDAEVVTFLNEAYTSDDSINWYSDALLAHKIVAVRFC